MEGPSAFGCPDTILLQNTDLHGNDLELIQTVLTYKQCCLACNALEACQAFTYLARTMKCWLKSDITSQGTGSSDSVSGIRQDRAGLRTVLTIPVDKDTLASHASDGMANLAESVVDLLASDSANACRDIRRVGGSHRSGMIVDGAWTVCFDKIITSPATGDQHNDQQSKCTVLSFGIADDFTFDDGMAGFGCEVHSFDPSMPLPNHKHATSVYFYSIGLGDANSNHADGIDMRSKKEMKWKIRTLDRLMRDLKVTSIDVLKVDIEGAEWSFLESALSYPPHESPLLHVQQLLVEVHLWKQSSKTAAYDVQRWFNVLRALRLHGFTQFWHHRNPLSTRENFGAGKIACCYEISFIKI